MSAIVSRLISVRKALDTHNARCPLPARSILINPSVMFPWDEVWSVPVERHAEVPQGRVRINCDGSTWKVEEELEYYKLLLGTPEA